MLGNTNSHIGHGGSGDGDTIYLTNESGSTITANQKVLCNLGTIGTSSPTSFTHTNSSYFNPILFFDSGAFLTTGSSVGYMHTLTDGVWSSASSADYRTWGQSSIFVFHKNGIISASEAFDRTSAKGYIFSKTGAVSLPNNIQYVGAYNNVHYCLKTDYYTVNVYDIDNNTVGAEAGVLYESSSYLDWAQVIGNKCMMTNTNRKFCIYEIANDGTFTLLHTTAISGYPLYVTGGGVGDYVFVTESVGCYRGDTTTASHLFCYQIQSDYSLAQVSVPALQAFESEGCYVCYDNRYDILSIGTANNVYFYQFDRYILGGNFINLNTSIGTYPSNPDSRPFRTMMAPDKSSIVIMGYGDYVNVYRLTTAYHRIVPNSAYYYNGDTSFTGKATGETDSSGKYEINMVLPQVVDWSIGSQYVEPDEVNIYGGAE